MVWGTGKPRRQFIYSLVRGGGCMAVPRLSPQACSPGCGEAWGSLGVGEGLGWHPGGAAAHPESL